MATAGKKTTRSPVPSTSSESPPRSSKRRDQRKESAAIVQDPHAVTVSRGLADYILDGADAVYRFLASLKLAILTLGGLVAVLAYATFYESKYGTRAVAEEIYKSPTFALLLTFLGANILCAALIRYPWKRRQIGFVVTHAGLLTILLGTFLTLRYADEGMLGMREGEATSQVVRSDETFLRVKTIDSQGQARDEFEIPFRPGNELWNPTRPDPQRFLAIAFFKPSLENLARAWAAVFTPDRMPPKSASFDVTEAGFRLEVLDHLPAAQPKIVHEAVSSGGVPMLHLIGEFQPPDQARLITLDQWLIAEGEFRRVTETLGPAKFTFQQVPDERALEEFLRVPTAPETRDFAWIRYNDATGKPRRYEWFLDQTREGQTITLPDSVIQVTFQGIVELDLGRLQSMAREGPKFEEIARKFARVLISDLGQEIPADAAVLHAIFTVKLTPDAPEEPYLAFDRLPIGASPNPGGSENANGSFGIGFVRPRLSSPSDFGRVEVAATPAGRLAYRVFAREGIRTAAPLRPGQRIDAFSGAGGRMTGAFRVEQVLDQGRQRLTYIPLDLPANQLATAIPAALVRFSVGDESREFWLRPSDRAPDWRSINLGGRTYQVAYDFRRHNLDFTIELRDFEVGFDPGTRDPSSYRSDILVSATARDGSIPPDLLLETPGTLGAGSVARAFHKAPHTVSMNKPYTNGWWTFYQANYDAIRDEEGRPTGEYMSVFQVRYDPIWCWGVVYLGCATVVLGTYLQFSMRAGVFSPMTQARTHATAHRRRPDEEQEPVETVAADTDSDAAARNRL